MGSLKKGLNISGLTRGNYVLTGVVVLTVVLLFFIPEIIGVNEHLDDQRAASDQKLSVSPKKTHSPLANLSEMVEEGYIDSLVLKKRLEDSRKDSKAGEDDDAGSVAKTSIEQELDPSCDCVPEEKRPDQFLVGELSWKKIRAPHGQKILKTAVKEANGLARNLPEDARRSRYAIRQYIWGVERVLAGAERWLKPDEVTEYLEYVDLGVTRAFKRDRLERAYLINWSEISLHPYVERAQRIKEEIRRTHKFRPKVMLTGVTVNHAYSSSGRRIPNGSSIVNLAGYVEGKDVYKARLYIDGEKVYDWKTHKIRKSGKLEFKVRKKNARGNFLFRLEDKYGEAYEKTYTFFSQASALPWTAKSMGNYKMPFNPGDPRLDRFFMLQERFDAEPAGGSRNNSSHSFGSF